MWQKFIVIICCLLFSPCYAKYQYHLSICTIFRDEAPYLKEWIEFHRLVGVEHFYLCSHNSQDHYKEVLAPYIKKGIVELTELHDSNHAVELFNQIQCGFYTDCLKKATNVSQWVAFIDSDEFLFPTQHSSLVQFLKSYEDFGGVVANWQMFGTSWLPQLNHHQLMIEQLIHCGVCDLEMNKHIKSIVQPIYVTHFYNPHYANYHAGYSQVNTDKIPFTGPMSPYVQVNQLRINHYWTRDENYFWNYKFPRQIQLWGESYGEGAKGTLISYNQEKDLAIQRFVPKLRKKMKLKQTDKVMGKEFSLQSCL